MEVHTGLDGQLDERIRDKKEPQSASAQPGDLGTRRRWP